ncbi:MAG: helix-turn-helix transcriptional regulator [Bacteroidetes bacterium]|nr:helix-turn-helix transcriptional regulator [Bacteroidota bacterium]MBS1939470.1 helix-turn-helix transcriptional regulator [Bacteroidota bacterium]
MAISSINWEQITDQQVVARLGKEIKRMRLEHNLSQAEVARRAGLDRTTIVKLEAGRAATLLTFVQVLRAMGRLELLDAFHQEPQPTPYMLVEAQEKYLKKQRKRASRNKPAVVPPKPKTSSW